MVTHKVYSVSHEERELMLGMYDVTSIVTIRTCTNVHCSKQNGRQKPALLQSEVALVDVLGRHGSVSLCRVERENKMAATYNVLAFKR